MNKKRLISIILTGAIVAGGTGAGFADTAVNKVISAPVPIKSSLTDISEHWAYDEITVLEGKGIMEAINGKFEPERILTRAEFVDYLDKVFNFNIDHLSFLKEPSLQDFYDDIPDDQWYSEALLKSSLNDVLTGEGRKFNPGENITRIEVAKAIEKSFAAKNLSVMMTLMFPVYDDTNHLTQEEISALSFVFNTGIMKGRTEQNFFPNEPITKAELAAVLNRTLTVMEKALSMEDEDTAQGVKDEIIMNGVISEVNFAENDKINSILVENTAESKKPFDQAVFLITENTKILKGNTETTEVHKGQNVTVEYLDGPVVEIYPVRIEAKLIKILE
ncbi:MAG: S-layer homology domain-containing protein [Peptococcaceae bacterium]